MATQTVEAPSEFLRQEGVKYKEQAEQILLKEDGSPAEAITEEQQAQADWLLTKSSEYADRAKDRQLTEQVEKRKGLVDQITVLGDVFDALPDNVPDDVAAEFAKGRLITPDRTGRKAKSAAAHLFNQEEFHRLREAGTAGGTEDFDYTRVKNRGLSTTFSLGPLADFMSKSLISTHVDNAQSSNWAAPKDDPEGDKIFIGSYYDHGVKQEPRDDLGMLDCIDVVSIAEKLVRWIVRERGTPNVRKHLEVKDPENPGEFGVKPFSSLGGRYMCEIAVCTIAHMYAMTQCALDSLPRLQSEINDDGRYALLEKMNGSILNGDIGSGDPFNGLLNTEGVGLLTSAGATFQATDTCERKILSGRTAVKKSKFSPNKVIVNCMTEEKLKTEKPSAGDCCVNLFYDPITGELVSSVHGMRLVVDEEVPDNQAIVGQFARRTICLFTNGEPRVDLTDSHANWFALNLLAARFEMSGVLGIKCPEAFAVIDLKK